jgi:gamma-glutamyltranspeptidase
VIFSLGNDMRSEKSITSLYFEIYLTLTSTLEKIAKHGSKGFYEGEIANYTIAAIQAQNGTMTLSDLSDYRVSIRKPISITYRNYTIYSYASFLT